MHAQIGTATTMKCLPLACATEWIICRCFDTFVVGEFYHYVVLFVVNVSSVLFLLQLIFRKCQNSVDMGAGTYFNYRLLAFGWVNSVYKYNNCANRAAITNSTTRTQLVCIICQTQ